MAGAMKKFSRKSIAEVSADTLKLQEYFVSCKPGEELSYVRIQHDTGVNMSESGKRHMASALKRAKLEYSTIYKYGLRLADASSTMPILSNKVTKIDRAVHRAEKTHRNLELQFFSSLSKDEQQKVLYIGAVFGAIRVAAQNGRIIYKKTFKNITDNVQIPIPKI